MQTIHIISHTHWDREWYQTFQQFRLKLVHLVDNLLDILEKDPEFKHFMLDGQTIVLDDYLAMRPENEAILRKYVQEGRILIGPWHILPDMFLVGPEAHIRNLLQGSWTASKFGPKMNIGYIPDPFGHPAQVPQILRGFGIQAACVWRGLDDEPAEFWWQAPDGSRVLMAYLRDSYSNGASLSADNLPAFAESLSALKDALAAHSAADDFLIMYGTDHMEARRNTSRAIAYANETLKDTRVIHSTLPAYIAAIQASLSGVELPVVEGELRACKRMHLLPGVLSTRMWIKQRNHASETLLTRWVEPFTTFAELVDAPEKRSDPSAYILQPAYLVRQTWRLLMENHPHDSICGCSIDQVHEEMKVRFDQVDQIGEELTRQSLERLAAEIDTRAEIEGQEAAIVVFNPCAFQRTEAVVFEIDLAAGSTAFDIVDETGRSLPYERLGMGTQELVNASMSPKELRASVSMINDGRVMGLGLQAIESRREGATVHLEVVFSEGEADKATWERGSKEMEALLDDPTVTTFQVRARTADVVKAVFCAPEIPGLGWRVFYVRASGNQSEAMSIPPLAGALLPLARRIAGTRFGQTLMDRLLSDQASKPPYRIENEFFKVEVEPAGTLSVTDKENGAVYGGLNRFVDGGDCGDEYNYTPPPDDLQVVPKLRSASVRRGAVRQALTLNLRLKTPAALDPSRKIRGQKKVDMPIKSVITLTQGVRRVDIHTEVDNRAEDHRLRAHFPTPFKVEVAEYDGHFEITRRPLSVPEFDRETWVEDPRPEVPQRAFTTVANEKDGLTLANRGLPEVEVLKTEAGSEIALTLLRCVGWMSRDDFSTRRGHAGSFMETPGAQMIGKWAFDYAICPHDGRGKDVAQGQAYAFEAPLRGVATTQHAGWLPGRGSFVAAHSVLDEDRSREGGFVVSAVKQAENGQGWLVRGYNPGREQIHLTLTPFKRFACAARANLAEQPLTRLAVDGTTGSVSLPVRGGEIVTVLFGTEQDVIILPFQPEDQAEVKELILAGLAEHWGRIDPSKNPDLNDIHSSYANATFLVGWMGSRIVGTGALVPRGEDTAEIVRMSVTADMRRKGIASQILRRLCEQARLDGRRRIVLETTETWDGVIEFYKQFGFQVTHHTGGDVYFTMQL